MSDTAVDPQQWRATFQETRSQCLRSFQKNLFDTSTGSWVDVEPSASEDWSNLWPPQQWQIAFEILFCQTPPAVTAALATQDDLLLFVYWADDAAHKPQPFFARRKAAALPPELRWGSALASEVDWRASVLLNIVLQTQYRLTVVRAPPWAIESALDGTIQTPPNPSPKQDLENPIHNVPAREEIMRVMKVVHASPSQTLINLDQTKAQASQPVASYPDICFAVDDFAEAFGALVLEEPTDCYCVALHADAAVSWGRALGMVSPTDEQPQSAPSKIERPREADKTTKEPPLEEAVASDTNSIAQRLEGMSLDSSQGEEPQLAERAPGRQYQGVEVFSGYVSCRQVTSALGSSLSSSPLKALTGTSSRTSKVLLRGPGGLGSADVAVTMQERKNSGTSSGDAITPPISKFMRAAAAVAKEVVDAARSVNNNGGSIREVKLRCALMSLAVPVEVVAEVILKAL